MRAVAHVAAPDGQWLTIHEASQLIGVSVATLRRWCDAGNVRAFTTPGGHRRFARSAVLSLVPDATQSHPRVGGNGETAIRIVRAYRRELRQPPAAPPTLEAISDAARQPYRDHGRAMVRGLIDSLDASHGDGNRYMARAQSGAAACGRIAALDGLSLQDAIALFVRFRGPFLHELGALARRWDLDAVGSTTLLEAASDAIDRLLPAMIGGYEEASVRSTEVAR
jgi:excisionase family DNA binding protein